MLTKGDPDYIRMHHIVRRRRGKATAQTCARCPSRARDWAQIHTESGLDPWADYIALCRSCHRIYDGISTVAGDARRGSINSPEHRAKIAAGRTGKHHTDETREKMSTVAKQTQAGRQRDSLGRYS